MKELPILFNTEMVQAAMSGQKTQTRRVITSGNTVGFSVKKSLLDFDTIYLNGTLGVKVQEKDSEKLWRGNCKYSEGDLLYVRETFGYEFEGDPEDGGSSKIVYKADPDANALFWKPSIFLPKEDSRIWCRVKKTWPEYIQDIRCDDILDEGVGVPQKTECHQLRQLWIELWNSINQSRGYGWEKNPPVWAIEFEMISDNGKPKHL